MSSGTGEPAELRALFAEDDDDGVVTAPSRKRQRGDGAVSPPPAAGVGTAGISDSGSASDSDSDSSDSSGSSSSSSSSSSAASNISDSAAGAPRKLKKLVKSGGSPQSAPAPRQRQPVAAAPASGAIAPAPRKTSDDSSDEYDSEPEVAPDAEDDAFIDREGDDEELVREYDDMKQDFRDEEPDGGRRKKKKRPIKRSAGGDDEGGGAERSGSGARGKGAGGKRKRELSDSDKARLVTELLDAMTAAAAADRSARRAGQPAVAKLKLLERLRSTAANTQLQTMLLEGANTGAEAMDSGANPTLLSVLREWLRPPPGGELPPLQLREAVYDVLARMPVRLDDLRLSRIGEVLFALSQHPAELPRNREALSAMIDRFSRSIFAKVESYRGNIGDMLEQQQRLGFVSAGAPTKAASAAATAHSASTAALAVADGAALDDADFGRLLGDDLAASMARPATTGARAGSAAPPIVRRHATRPEPLVMDYVVRPDLPSLAPSERAASAADAQGAGLSKKLAELRRKGSRPAERGGAAMSYKLQ